MSTDSETAARAARTYRPVPRDEAAAHPPHKTLAAFIQSRLDRHDRPVLIAIGGPGGIGKSTFAVALAAALDEAAVLALDDYKTSRAERATRGLYGPHPEANRIALLREHLHRLRVGLSIDKPCYCRQRGEAASTVPFAPARYTIVEGEIATYGELRDCFDFSIFIDAHWRTQLNTRIVRDIEQRGYTPRKAIETFLHSNLLEFDAYGAPSKNLADVHLHCDVDYRLAVDAVCATLEADWQALAPGTGQPGLTAERTV